MAKEFYCPNCKCWVKKSPNETTYGSRRRHNELCIGDPISQHPDLIDLDAELEYFFGEA